MVQTLNDPSLDFTDDSRVRPAINTFLAHFMSKYAADFQFMDDRSFGDINEAVKRSINFFEYDERCDRSTFGRAARGCPGGKGRGYLPAR